MKWSLKLGTYAGIGVYLHWTFALLIGWVFLAHLGAGESAGQALAGVAFILALFGCVVLHEFGHALTARRYGVKTRDITLLPIGGVARLERIPERPMQEFWVALAGPAVNVVIAALIFVALVVLGGASRLLDIEWFRGRFLEQLMWVNLMLAAFNLLPAFPMDGGRVLRSFLAARIGRPRATAIAANIGQALAIVLGVVGFFHNPFLVFIAIFVFLGAQSEASQVETESVLDGLEVRDAMMRRFRTLAAADRLDRAVEELLAGSQQDFPVLEDGRVIGLLRRNDLVKALAEGRREATVGEVMGPGCRPVEESAPLMGTLEAMSAEQVPAVPVMAGGTLVGLLNLENIGELIMVNRALAASAATAVRRPAPAGPPPL